MMPAASTAAMPTGFDVDRAANTIRFERQLAASPLQAFAAWTEPEQLRLWWDAAGKPLQRCEMDLRVGGDFIFVTQDHAHMPFTGTYREIVPGERLAFDALGSLGRVLFRPEGAGTRMTVEIDCGSAEQLEHFLQVGVHVGTSTTLDNLVRHLERSTFDQAAS